MKTISIWSYNDGVEQITASIAYALHKKSRCYFIIDTNLTSPTLTYDLSSRFGNEIVVKKGLVDLIIDLEKNKWKEFSAYQLSKEMKKLIQQKDDLMGRLERTTWGKLDIKDYCTSINGNSEVYMPVGNLGEFGNSNDEFWEDMAEINQHRKFNYSILCNGPSKHLLVKLRFQIEKLDFDYLIFNIAQGENVPAAIVFRDMISLNNEPDVNLLYFQPTTGGILGTNLHLVGWEKGEKEGAAYPDNIKLICSENLNKQQTEQLFTGLTKKYQLHRIDINNPKSFLRII